jgi:hypothetical protein
MKYIIGKFHTASYGNPSPTFPDNTFGQPLSTSQISEIKIKGTPFIIQNRGPLWVFLNNEILWKNSTNWKNTMIEVLNSSKLRWRSLKEKDSQDNYTGMWTNRSKKITQIETYISQMNQLAPITAYSTNWEKEHFEDISNIIEAEDDNDVDIIDREIPPS